MNDEGLLCNSAFASPTLPSACSPCQPSWSGAGGGLLEGAVSGLVVTDPEEAVYAIAAGRIWMSANGVRS
jgi:hypothetical protein